MNLEKRIYIAGHRGMVGSAILRKLQSNGFKNLIFRTHFELDLTNQKKVANFFSKEKPEYVFLAAAKVGGIYANNTYPAEFIYENLMIQNNVIHQAYLNGVKKLIFLGSSCIYPKLTRQPIDESCLLSAKLEETNKAYAIAKISGIAMCASYNKQYLTDFRSLMPTNLYGPGDNYHSSNSHVIPALIRRFHEAKISNHDTVTIWGSGKPKREFLYVDDLADAAIHVLSFDKKKFQELTLNQEYFLNVGYGKDISINELAKLISEVTGFTGKINFDKNKPDGTQRKLLNSEKSKSTKWFPKIELKDRLEKTYKHFKKI